MYQTQTVRFGFLKISQNIGMPNTAMILINTGALAVILCELELGRYRNALFQYEVSNFRKECFCGCAATKGSSQLPWTDIKPLDDFEPWLIRTRVGESVDTGSRFSHRKRWYDVVEDNSSRVITKESDKLPALSGLASEFASPAYTAGDESGVSQYCAGLWYQDMPSALLWRTVEQRSENHSPMITAFFPRRPMEYRAPSWSWAAIDGAVTYDSQRVDSSRAPRPDEDFVELHRNDFEMLSANISLRGRDVYGSVRNGQLRVRGRTVWMNYDNKGVSEGHEMRYLTLDDGSKGGIIFPDILFEMSGVRRVVCLAVGREPFWSHQRFAGEILLEEVNVDMFGTSEQFNELGPFVMGLALIPVEGHEALVYRRRGLVRWMKMDFFRDVEPVDITIL